jgi:hypothetical protein
MFGYLTFLHAEHIEPKRLVVLTVLAGPRLAHVDDDHVVLADHIHIEGEKNSKKIEKSPFIRGNVKR